MQQNPNLFAGLGPFAGLAQAGSQLATRGIQGLFGIKDPEIEAQRAIAMAAQNPNDPATLQAAAQALAQAGKIDQAMALAGQARQITQQKQQFGLEQERLGITRSQAEQQAKQGDERLKIARDELELKKEQFDTRKDLTDLEIKKAKKELAALERNYTPSLYRDNAGNALFNKQGEVGLFYFDESTNTIKRHKSSQGLTTIKPPTPSPYDFLAGARAGGNAQPPLAAGQPQAQAGPFPGVSVEALRAEQQRRAQQK